MSRAINVNGYEIANDTHERRAEMPIRVCLEVIRPFRVARESTNSDCDDVVWSLAAMSCSIDKSCLYRTSDAE